MSRKKRQNSDLKKLIFLAVVFLFAVSQASPGIQTVLLNSVLKPLMLIGFIVVGFWFIATLMKKPSKNEPWLQRKTMPRITPKPQLSKATHSDIPTEVRAKQLPKPVDLSSSWSLALLQDLEWKRFELLCEAYFKTKNLDARVTKVGADGGVDIQLYKHNSNETFALMQCKAWKGLVGIKPIREFYGVMASEGIQRGIFLCSHDYTVEAKKFCEGKGLRLMTGKSLLNAIQKLDDAEQTKLLTVATQGDYRTPTCPNCDIKLTERKGKQDPFWGCLNFPRCRYTLRMRRSRKAS